MQWPWTAPAPPWVLDGPINAESFVGFCEWLLAPSLLSGDVVVVDNLSSHKSVRSVQTIETVGARVVYLPPYSPDLNPIDKIFSEVKHVGTRHSPQEPSTDCPSSNTSASRDHTR